MGLRNIFEIIAVLAFDASMQQNSVFLYKAVGQITKTTQFLNISTIVIERIALVVIGKGLASC